MDSETAKNQCFNHWASTNACSSSIMQRRSHRKLISNGLKQTVKQCSIIFGNRRCHFLYAKNETSHSVVFWDLRCGCVFCLIAVRQKRLCWRRNAEEEWSWTVFWYGIWWGSTVAVINFVSLTVVPTTGTTQQFYQHNGSKTCLSDYKWVH